MRDSLASAAGRMTRPAAPPGVHSREDEKTGAVPYGRSR